MNTEQAYINGFIKRAAQYGLDNAKALVLLKEATTFGATKALLRQMQSQGIKLHRAPLSMVTAMASARNFPMTKDRASKKLLTLLTSLMETRGPAYISGNIYVPRGNFKINRPMAVNNSSNEYTSRMRPPGESNARIFQKNVELSPRNALFHEAGHAMHDLEDPRYFNLVNNRADGARANKEMLATERIANNNAINFMRQNNVPTKNIENYMNNVNTMYGTYSHQFNPQFKQNNKFYPGYSV